MFNHQKPSTQVLHHKQQAQTKVSNEGVRWRMAFLAALTCLLLGASSAWSQLTISITHQGPSAPFPVDPGGAYLVTPGPGATPNLFWGPASLGFPVYGIYNSRELDALSWGRDSMLKQDGIYWGGNYRLFFSTDEFASGDPTVGPPPTVLSEGVFGNQEASADVQRVQLFMSQPAPPIVTFYDHRSQFDGNGFTPWFPVPGPELGLVEPNAPFPGPDMGDTLDALDAWTQSSSMRLYFSLDADWTDPLEGPYGNVGTAQANLANPGDVLVSDGMGTFSVFAPAGALGLDLNDDLDALILWENGNGSFDASTALFEWVDGSTDMLLFSVRRGSPIIGTPDSSLGWPIEEGDILTTPCNVLPCSGGAAPAIFISAESLGLGTVRNGTDSPFLGFGDDLDAMMVR